MKSVKCVIASKVMKEFFNTGFIRDPGISSFTGLWGLYH